MKKEDKSNLVDEAEEESTQEINENGFVGDKESPMKSTTVRLCGNWKLEGLTLVILVVVIFSVAVTVAMVIHILVGPPQVVPHGAATSMSTICSKAAVQMMKTEKAGAVDGAVTAALCESVTMSHSSGLGGGALMYIYSQKGRNGTLLDCREAAPSGSTQDMFKGRNSQATSGGLSVAVPGYLKCLYSAHKRFGKLKWSVVVKPAIDVATNGFPMPKDLHDKLTSDKALFDKVKSSAVLSNLYLTSNKTAPVPVGTKVKPTQLAKTLEKISKSGDSVFYSGELASDIVDTVTKNSGIMKTSDLSSYQAKYPSPVTGHFNHFTVLTFPLPSKGGPLLLSTLDALNAYGVYRSLLQNETSIPGQVKTPNNLYYQRLVEILRASVVAVDKLGAGSNSSQLSSLIGSSAAKNLIKNIQANVSTTPNTKAPTPMENLPSGETTLSVQGPDNVIVSFAGSLGALFGSGVATPSGIILNNAMGAFSLPDISPVNNENLPGPSLRPLTPLSPFIVHNPRRRCGVRFGAAASGGMVAPQASAQVVVAAVLWDVPKCREKDCLDLAAAVSQARLAVSTNTKTVQVETGISQSAINYLKSIGNTVKEVPKSLGDVQAAGEVQHIVTAYSDPRYAGKAETY